MTIEVNQISTEVSVDTSVNTVEVGSTPDSFTVTAIVSEVEVVSAGIQGPEGAGSEGLPLRVTDLTSEVNIYYKGWSLGVDQGAGIWRILRGLDNLDGTFTEKYAVSYATTTNIWDDRLSLTYVDL